MKASKLTLVNPLTVLVTALIALPGRAEQATVLKTDQDKASYAVGAFMARNFKQQGIDVNADALIKGFRDVLDNQPLLLNDENLRHYFGTFQSEVKRKQIEARGEMAKQGRENGLAGEAFLAGNKTKKGVVTLPSGLQYLVLKEGNGPKPADTDTVECKYRGTSVNGTEFDNSERAGRPTTFKVSEVIPGWREALKLMPVGSKWRLFIPPQLAYGDRGASANIGPNATLIFDVELLGIKNN